MYTDTVHAQIHKYIHIYSNDGSNEVIVTHNIQGLQNGPYFIGKTAAAAAAGKNKPQQIIRCQMLRETQTDKVMLFATRSWLSTLAHWLTSNAVIDSAFELIPGLRREHWQSDHECTHTGIKECMWVMWVWVYATVGVRKKGWTSGEGVNMGEWLGKFQGTR